MMMNIIIITITIIIIIFNFILWYKYRHTYFDVFCTNFLNLSNAPKTAGACPHFQLQTGLRVRQP